MESFCKVKYLNQSYLFVINDNTKYEQVIDFVLNKFGLIRGEFKIEYLVGKDRIILDSDDDLYVMKSFVRSHAKEDKVLEMIVSKPTDNNKNNDSNNININMNGFQTQMEEVLKGVGNLFTPPSQQPQKFNDDLNKSSSSSSSSSTTNERKTSSNNSPSGFNNPDIDNIYNMLRGANIELPPKEVVQAQVEEALKGVEQFFSPTTKQQESGGVVKGKESTKESTNPNNASSTANSNPNKSRHPAICDLCEVEIVGIRYKCYNCADYDVCESCEPSSSEKHPNHLFIKIREPFHATYLQEKHRKGFPAAGRGMFHHPFHQAFHPQNATTPPQSQSNCHGRRWPRGGSCYFRRVNRDNEQQPKEQPKEQQQKPKPSEQQQQQQQVKKASGVAQLRARFVKDVTLPDGTAVAPQQKLVKIFRMRNEGEGKWPEGVRLSHVGGDRFSDFAIRVPAIEAGEEIDIALDITAPEKAGRYTSYFRMTEPKDQKRFGHRVWVDILVEDPQDNEEEEEVEKKTEEDVAVVRTIELSNNSNVVVSEKEEEGKGKESIRNSSASEAVSSEVSEEEKREIEALADAVVDAVVEERLSQSGESSTSSFADDFEKIPSNEEQVNEDNDDDDNEEEEEKKNDDNSEESSQFPVDLADSANEWSRMLVKLDNMGFKDSNKNMRLLVKYNGDVLRLIEALLNGEE